VANLAFHDFDYFLRHVLGIISMGLVPLLKLFHLTAELNIELDVIRQTGNGEVAGAHQTRRADYSQFAVGDVCLGMKLFLCINAAGNLAALQCLNDGQNRDVKAGRNFCSLRQIVKNFPIVIAIVNNKQFISGLFSHVLAALFHIS
jgi:hypothetical protein